MRQSVLSLSLNPSAPSDADSPRRFGGQKSLTPVLAFALPGKGSDHLLAGINGTGLFSRPNGELVALQLEKSHLVLPGQKLVPGDVDLGGELVALDCEW